MVVDMYNIKNQSFGFGDTNVDQLPCTVSVYMHLILKPENVKKFTKIDLKQIQSVLVTRVQANR